MMEKYYNLNFSDITTRRLDPWHYQPSFVNQLNKIINQKSYYTLDEVIDANRNIAGGATPLGSNYPETGTIKFYRSGEVKETYLDYESAVFLSNEDNEKLKRSQLMVNDIVLSITGAKFGKSAVVQKYNCPGNISQHSVRFHMNTSRIDPSFLVAYLNSPTGQTVIWKEAYGGTRPAIDYPGIRSLIIPKYNLKTQKYIGDKVRQAEQLRVFAKILKMKYSLSLNNVFSQLTNNELLTSKKDNNHEIYKRVSAKELHPRIDAWFYKPIFIDSERVLKKLKESGIPLISIKDMASVDYGFMPLENYWDSDKGSPFIRVTNIENHLVISEKDIKYVNPELSNFDKYKLKEDDILVVQLGNSTGRIGYLSERYKNWIYPSFSLRVRVNSSNFDPGYVALFLAEYLGQSQIQRSISITSVRPNTTKPAIESLLIPEINLNIQKKIGKYVRNFVSANENSNCLIQVAKSLVEGLIEGQITEQQLIDAQTDLEAGDDSIDKSILFSITDKGINAEGKPLFDDIDKLYALIQESHESIEQKDDE
ncbi:restriction endonuclease subunit S [Legionella pneumophila serogroup 1]